MGQQEDFALLDFDTGQDVMIPTLFCANAVLRTRYSDTSIVMSSPRPG